MKRRLRLFIYWLLAALKSPLFSKKILIVKTDAIGDYILFRNCFETIVNSAKFQAYSFHLLGNPTYSDLVELLDNKLFKKVFWLDLEKIKPLSIKNRTYLLFILKLKMQGYDYLINTVHSRKNEIDNIIRFIGAKKNIASFGDDVNTKSNIKETNDLFYNKLLPVSGPDHFEFFRNVEFTKGLLDENHLSIPFSISLPLILNDSNKQRFKILIFPGAGQSFRAWSPVNFATVIKLIASRRNDVDVFIGGSAIDQAAAKIISDQLIEMQVHDKTGKTNLLELLYLIKSANLLISNDTSAVHMAAALGKSAICISNGNHFGRFNPYPKEIGANILTVYPSEDFYHPEKYNEMVELTKIRSLLDINKIHPEEVFKKILENNLI